MTLLAFACVLGVWTSMPAADARVPHVAQEEPLVVLVPGFMGANMRFAPYFTGWVETLERAGHAVVVIVPPPLDSSEERGAFLARTITRSLAERGRTRAVVIAHSQGGVDTRVALDLLPRGTVAAVATMSSPHHGTDVADVARAWPKPLVDKTLQGAASVMQDDGVHASSRMAPQDALGSLSRDGMRAFNERHPLRADIPFFSFGAASGADHDGACDDARWAFSPRARSTIHPFLFVGRDMIAASRNVAQDGVVPTASMRFGTFLGCIAGDHVDWQGWPRLDDRFDELAFARELARALVDVAAGGAAAMEPHVPAFARLARATWRQ